MLHNTWLLRLQIPRRQDISQPYAVLFLLNTHSLIAAAFFLIAWARPLWWEECFLWNMMPCAIEQSFFFLTVMVKGVTLSSPVTEDLYLCRFSTQCSAIVLYYTLHIFLIFILLPVWCHVFSIVIWLFQYCCSDQIKTESVSEITTKRGLIIDHYACSSVISVTSLTLCVCVYITNF